MYGFNECEQTLTQWMCKYCLDSEDQEETSHDRLQLFGKVGLNSVLLTEIDYNEEQNLTENLVSASAETESWGGSDLGRNPEDRCDLPEALNRKEVHGSNFTPKKEKKAGMNCNVSHFPIGLVITS